MRIYLIGAGAISRRHAEASLKLVSSSELELHVCDVSERTLASFIEAFPLAIAHDSVDEMLAEDPAADDVVVVATPPVTHYDLVIAALTSGRNVLCEKPLAMSREEALSMIETARNLDLHLESCDSRLIGTATSNEVKRLLDQHDLGRVYHATFINRSQRNRSGVEYQPQTKWFLDKKISGGGTLMDWGPYDLAILDELFEPERVEVLSAWLATPETGVADSVNAPNETEQHVGASLRYFRHNGEAIDVTYERAACTHGEPRVVVEIEGLSGAVSWEWIDWSGTGLVRSTHDQAGRPISVDRHLPPEDNVGAHDRPLAHFLQHIALPTNKRGIENRSIFNFLCLQAIYECASSGEKQIVSEIL